MAFYIVNEHEVTDPVAFQRYPALAAPSIIRGGGRILARSERSEALEGAPSKRAILLEFPDKATAMAGRASRPADLTGFALLHSHLHQRWTVASLARQLGFSRFAFAARFTELVGEPPFRYLTRLRINAVASRLSSGDDKLGAVATSAGYESVAALAKAFKRHTRMTPGQYRQAFGTGGSG